MDNMSPEQIREQIKETVKNSVSFSEAEFKRLKERDREYSRLLSVLNILQDQNLLGDQVLTISQKHQIQGMSWHETVNLAVCDMVVNLPVWHERVEKYINNGNCQCLGWCRVDHTGIHTLHNLGCNHFDWFCELHYMSRELIKTTTKERDQHKSNETQMHWFEEFLKFVKKVADGGFNVDHEARDLLKEYESSGR